VYVVNLRRHGWCACISDLIDICEVRDTQRVITPFSVAKLAQRISFWNGSKMCARCTDYLRITPFSIAKLAQRLMFWNGQDVCSARVFTQAITGSNGTDDWRQYFRMVTLSWILSNRKRMWARRDFGLIVGKIQSTAMRTDLLHSGVDRYGVEIWQQPKD